MENNIKNIIQQKLHMIKSFYYTITLQPNAAPQNIIEHGTTTYYLKSVIMELLIKALYESEFKESHKNTHNLKTVFDKINKSTKNFVELQYNNARERQLKPFKANNITDVEFPDLYTTFDSNTEIIRDFKYNATGNKNNSSLDGIFLQEILTFIEKKLSKI